MGTLDAACDHIGQSKWMAQMEWTGQEGFLAAPTKDWLVDGHVAGVVKEFGDLVVRTLPGYISVCLWLISGYSSSRCLARDISCLRINPW